MGYFIVAVGGFTLLLAIGNFLGARSAMHETTAAVFWGGGWLLIAAGCALIRLNKAFKVVPGERPKSDDA